MRAARFFMTKYCSAGALPAFALVFVLGRRYLRRLGSFAMETA